MVMPLTRRRFTVDEFQRMAQAGILGEDDRVELLDGEIVEMTPIGVAHAACVTRLGTFLGRRLGNAATVRIQCPVVLASDQQPQPDVAVVRFRADGYRDGHPEPTNTFLVIEVADASLRTDRAKKIPLYARAGIPETWLVNLPDDTVEVHRDLRDGRYADARGLHRGDTIAPLAFPELTLDVNAILG